MQSRRKDRMKTGAGVNFRGIAVTHYHPYNHALSFTSRLVFW
ncbi:MAG TPA: hypothetical protein VGL22_09720 [Terracidiphilus sp.]